MFTVGLTGGIGSGKSTVADLFAELGVPVIDTDVIAREMTGPGGVALDAIRAAFGETVMQADGTLNRALMRHLVFADREARRRLEAILHPRIPAMLITPICSHTLTNRPIVLPDDFTIQVILKTLSEDVYLTLDGQVGFSLRKDDVIEINKSPFKTKLLVPCERDYFNILRTKLKWGER